MKLKSIFKRDILLLWFSRSFSRFGDAFESIALMYLVYELTGSGLAMGATMIFSVLPNAFLSPIAGVFADRYNKKKIMFISEIVRAISILIIPLLLFTGNLKLWHVYAISFFVSIAESFYEPSFGKSFVLIIGKKELPVVNSIITTSNHLMRMLGYTLAGIFMSVLAKGMELIFIVDSVTFLVSGFIALALNIPVVENKEEIKKSSVGKEFKEGLLYVAKHKIILQLISVFTLLIFLAAPLGVLLPLLIEEVLHVDKVWLGYLSTAGMVGTIGGTILTPILMNKSQIKFNKFYLVSFLLLSFVFLVISNILNPFAYIPVLILFSLTMALLQAITFTYMQQIIEGEYLGRVFGFISMFGLMASPLSAALFGYIADNLPLVNVLMFVGLLCLVMAPIVFIKFPKESINIATK